MDHPLRTAGQLVAVAIAYAILGFLLYRARATSDAAVWASDLLVFYGPAVSALAILTYLSWREFRRQQNRVVRLTLSIGTGLLVTVLTAWAYALVAFNHYGT